MSDSDFFTKAARVAALMGKTRKHQEGAGTQVTPPSRCCQHQGIRNDLCGRRQLPSCEQSLHNTTAVVAKQMNPTRRVVYLGWAARLTVSDVELHQTRPLAA